MKIKLQFKLSTGLIFCALFFAGFPVPAQGITIAEQVQGYDSTLSVWQVIQELGDNLSGTVTTFTFRVSTSVPNSGQFDFTGQNSRIYDKTANTYINGCLPAGTNPSDQLRGLTFTTANVPSGYEDVTIDFSCRNYTFVQGHRYLILLTNANSAWSSGNRMKLASTVYTGTANDYFTGGGLRYAYDNGTCNAAAYVWNSQSSNKGCNIFGTYKSDLYFTLNNSAPPPRLPVIFIPGIGGSELKASQDIIWSKEDGRSGIYSHAYSANEKIWVNQNEAAALGNDDYFDVLRLKADGTTAEADLSLTGNLTSYGYPDIDSFFEDNGYTKNTNYFVFPYDWRKDIRSTRDSLDSLIETAKTASGQQQVNLVVHSMGGLVARYYISDPSKASKVNKLIELGVPHLGAVDSLKTLKYGSWLGYDFKIIRIGIPPSEIKNLAQNTTALFQLLPSVKYFDFYNNSNQQLLFPFKDDRDIDNNNVTGALNFNQTKTLLSNLNYNMTVFDFGEQFHNGIDSTFGETNGTDVYEIVGSAQPTLGQIRETWWLTWPVNLIQKRDEIFINGDGTVPLYSAALKNDSLDISGAEKIYYVEQKHGDLVSSNGTAMQTVRAILEDDNSLPTQVKEIKITLEGHQISLDDGEMDLYDDQNRHCGLNSNGEMEENIPEVTCTTSGSTKHAFVKKKASKVKVKTTRKTPSNSSKKTNLKIRIYRNDAVSKSILYKDVSLDENSKIEFELDPDSESAPTLTYYPDETQSTNSPVAAASEVSGTSAMDQTAPATTFSVSGTKDSSNIYTGPATITLTGSDADSGILRIEYSTDNGQSVQTYTGPFTISASGQTSVQFKAIDNTGNEEITQTLNINIAPSPTPTPSSSSGSSSNSSSDSSNNSTSSLSTSSNSSINNTASAASTKDDQPKSLFSSGDVLGMDFEDSAKITNEINLSGLLEQQKKDIKKKTINPYIQNLGGLLMISGGLMGLASIGLLTTLLKPIPK